MRNKNKVYSGIEGLPSGSSSEKITSGCLVLEGGAFRGLYGEGVLDALMEEDINLQCTIGVSAGAMNGMNYVSGQIGRSARTNLRYRHNSHYVGAVSLKRNHGPIGFDFIFRELAELGDPLDEERFFRPEQRFIAVATNCNTGKTEYFEKGKCGDIFQAIRASASMPYISKPVTVDGIPCLDGGCSVSIPYQWAIDHEFEKIVIVKTRPDDWRNEDSSERQWPYRFYRSNPEFAKALAFKEARYNAACDEIEVLRQSNRVFVISPSRSLPVGRLEGDMEKLGELYYMGYHDAKAAMEDLKKYLSI